MAPTTTMPRSGLPATSGPPTRGPTRFVWAVTGLAVAARLPFLRTPAGADEAGFLQVAHQWSPGGGSLYGHYWVDRPPLLITLFQTADLAGGLTALRLLGCVAVAVTVLFSSAAARRLAGSTAARWTAVVTAALLASPFAGSEEINGELLAAPFVAAGLLGLIAASQSPHQRRALLQAAAAGAAGVAAVMVKQNIIDVFVFGSVFLLVGAWSHRGAVPRARRLLGATVVGAAAALALVSAWTLARGTSPTGVLDAMYPFRLQAARVVASGGSQYASARGARLALDAAASGLALLAATMLLTALRHPRRDAATLALATTVVYDSVSIAVGGGYWSHYLVELVVPLAIWVGALAARGRLAPRLSGALVAVLSVAAVVAGAFSPATSSGHSVGASIARVARPGDTLTTLYGEPQVNFASGLASPYEYLWSLPIKTRDPHLDALAAVLSGPHAPTWVVVAHEVRSWGLDTTRTQTLLSTDYHPVAVVDSQTIYLRNGVVRVAPTPDASVASPSVSSPSQERP